MKKFTEMFVLAIASMVALSSCAKENVINNDTKTPGTVIKGSFEDMTKTALSSEYQIKWSEDDVIVAFDHEENSYISTKTTVSENGLVAEFSFDETVESEYALFPANEGAIISAGTISTVLPATQYPVPDGFDTNANIALSKTVDNTAKFYNACTLIGFEIKNDDIKSISIKSDKAFAGDCIVYEGEDGFPVLESIEGEAGKLTLEADFVKGNTYYAVVFPEIYTGLTITFKRADGNVAKFTNAGTLDLSHGRNCITTIFDKEIADGKWTSPILFMDDFSKFDNTDGDGSQALSTKSFVGSVEGFEFSYDTYLYKLFPSGKGPDGYGTTGDGCVKGGSSNNGGQLQLPELGTETPQDVIISFQFKGWEKTDEKYRVMIDGTNVEKYIVNGDEVSEDGGIFKAKAEDGWINVSCVCEGLTKETAIVIGSAGGERLTKINQRFWLDNLKVEMAN